MDPPIFPALDAWLIAGPTASGKSALALALARRTGAVVVNADAMQVYAGLSVITARPSPAEEAAAPHALYGHVPMDRAFSVAAFLADAQAVFAGASAEGRPVVVVGGTGLYFTALVDGLSPVPPVPAPVRARWRERAAALPAPALHAELAARDPAMAARLRPSDPQRIVRALEVLEGTGRSLADWQAEPRRRLLARPAEAGGRTGGLVLAPDRAWLRGRIAERFEAMLAAGALEEARAARDLPPHLPAAKALGLQPLLAHLSGHLSLAEAAGRAVADTRRYAKRQETWFRGRFPGWPRLCPPADPDAAAGALAARPAGETFGTISR